MVRAERKPAVTRSVKIPARTKPRVVRAAREAGVTVHAYLVDVIEQATERAEKRRAFVDAARASREETRRTGRACRAEDVHAFFEARRRGENPPRPKRVRIR
jgi:glycerophosphoryl diester phosphodiesterase